MMGVAGGGGRSTGARRVAPSRQRRQVQQVGPVLGEQGVLGEVGPEAAACENHGAELLQVLAALRVDAADAGLSAAWCSLSALGDHVMLKYVALIGLRIEAATTIGRHGHVRTGIFGHVTPHRKHVITLPRIGLAGCMD